MEQKAICEISAESRLLLQFLINDKTPRFVSYGDIFRETGVDIQTHRSAWTTAKKRALVENGLFWEAVHGRGIKLLKEEEKPAVAVSRVRKARGQARRGLREIKSIDIMALNPENRLSVAVQATQLHMIEQAGGIKASNTIARQISASGQQLQLADAYEALKKSIVGETTL